MPPLLVSNLWIKESATCAAFASSRTLIARAAWAIRIWAGVITLIKFSKPRLNFIDHVGELPRRTRMPNAKRVMNAGPTQLLEEARRSGLGGSRTAANTGKASQTTPKPGLLGFWIGLQISHEILGAGAPAELFREGADLRPIAGKSLKAGLA